MGERAVADHIGMVPELRRRMKHIIQEGGAEGLARDIKSREEIRLILLHPEEGLEHADIPHLCCVVHGASAQAVSIV